MLALALGLIRGSIDQVDEKLNMHWVKPRVLDLRQVGTLKKRLDQWTNDVKQMSTLVEQQAERYSLIGYLCFYGKTRFSFEIKQES